MIKNKFKFLVFLLALSFIGCDDYLSELPDNRTEIDSKDKISALLTAAYPEGNYQLMAELMSDNAGEKTLTGGDDLDIEMYQWLDSNLDDRDTPNFYWNNCYEAISQANQALASSYELSENDNLGPQIGEALLARAYAHFMLVNFWAKPYNPNTADSDLGVPYVTEPETVLIKKYKRNTVQEVYDLIEADILEGLKTISNEHKEPKFHFTKDAANAFASRFYLYKGEWDKVINHANKVVSDPSNELRDMVVYRGLTYDENGRSYASALERSNLLITSTASLWDRKYAGSNFGLNVEKADELFFSGTGNPFRKAWAYAIYGGTDLVYNFPKYEEYFRLTNQSAGIGFPFVGVVLFDKDEVLLNRAEAYAMKDDYTNSLKDLNGFLALKTTNHFPATDILTEAMVTSSYPVVADEYTPFYTLTDTQFSFVKAIAQYKRREYYHEGLRWFDVKRFNLEVTHKFRGSPIVLTKEDNRKQLQIPQSAQNFDIKPNPR